MGLSSTVTAYNILFDKDIQCICKPAKVVIPKTTSIYAQWSNFCDFTPDKKYPLTSFKTNIYPGRFQCIHDISIYWFILLNLRKPICWFSHCRPFNQGSVAFGRTGRGEVLQATHHSGGGIYGGSRWPLIEGLYHHLLYTLDSSELSP